MVAGARLEALLGVGANVAGSDAVHAPTGKERRQVVSDPIFQIPQRALAVDLIVRVDVLCRLFESEAPRRGRDRRPLRDLPLFHPQEPPRLFVVTCVCALFESAAVAVVAHPPHAAPLA